MPLIDGADEYENLLWLDVEASGLHAGSYPIEVGWCSVSLEPTSFLIRPLPIWSIEEWSLQAEHIHGISRKLLEECGRHAVDVATWLNVAARRKTVLSDNPGFDAAWLDKLYLGIGVPREFDLADATDVAGEARFLSKLPHDEADSLLARVHARYPHPHRAGPDARRNAAEFLTMAMPHMLQEIEEMA